MSNNAHGNGETVGGIGLVTVILALIFLFVWPGPFRYDFRGPSATVKIDRISHQVWDYSAGDHKWVKR